MFPLLRLEIRHMAIANRFLLVTHDESRVLKSLAYNDGEGEKERAHEIMTTYAMGLQSGLDLARQMITSPIINTTAKEV